MGPTGAFGIAEVKEGKKNRRISEFMNFYLRNPCDKALFYFAKQEGRHSVEQLGRMVRQASRMGHVTEVMSKGTSVDPDTEQTVKIPDDYIVVDSWDEELNNILKESASKGWALSVIDDCLFVGAYSGDFMRKAGYRAFSAWFDSCGATPGCPRSTLLDAMQHPLALPVFNMNIPVEDKFDILFGRKQVCLGINMEMLLNQCRELGLGVRMATNKEATRMDQMGNHPYRHKGRAIVLGNGEREMTLMDGIIIRIFFHSQRPVKLLKALLDNEGGDPHRKAEDAALSEGV